MKRLTRANTFLLEMIIVLLFFSLAAAVTLTFFSKAHRMASNSQELNYAVIAAQDFAESLLADKKEGPPSPLSLYYDQSWAEIDSIDDSAYSLTCIPHEDQTDGGVSLWWKLTIRRSADGETVYSLELPGEYSPKPKGGVS